MSLRKNRSKKYLLLAFPAVLIALFLTGRYVPGFIDQVINSGHNPYDPSWAERQKFFLVAVALVIAPLVTASVTIKWFWENLFAARKNVVSKLLAVLICFLFIFTVGLLIEYYSLESFGDVCVIEMCID